MSPPVLNVQKLNTLQNFSLTLHQFSCRTCCIILFMQFYLWWSRTHQLPRVCAPQWDAHFKTFCTKRNKSMMWDESKIPDKKHFKKTHFICSFSKCWNSQTGTTATEISSVYQNTSACLKGQEWSVGKNILNQSTISILYEEVHFTIEIDWNVL